MRYLTPLFVAFVLSIPAVASAQYNAAAGASVPMEDVLVETRDEDSGAVVKKKVKRRVKSDSYGNADGSKYDLAIDGAFDGATVTVLHFYTGGGFDFRLPREALAEKGFSVVRYSGKAPSPRQLAEALSKSNQLWIISGARQYLDERHLKVIKRFYEEGHGLYLWGDNPPYTHDANFVANALFGVEMDRNTYKQAEKVVTLQRSDGAVGLAPNHLITTGIEHLYEGHTIPALHNEGEVLEPLIVGSDKILVAGFYDKEGRRAIVDTGFTRLYINWDTAGTGRYVKNAAAWLANAERFGTPSEPKVR